MRYLLASMARTITVRFAALAAAFVLAVPASGAAQTGLGIGPRFSFINSHAVDVASPDVRYFGGVLRLHSSATTAFEVSFDYRSTTNKLGTKRTRDIPLQLSVLKYVGQSQLSPYLLGGVGWYKSTIGQYANDTLVTETALSKMGYHAGVGAEVRVHPRASVPGDYRYTFIRFGDDSGNTAPGAVPIPFTQSLQERLKLSPEGSMWTTGVTFHF